MASNRYVVLGSGPAGTRASETLRKRDPDARVVVVTDEPHPFYNRIPLSKDFLANPALGPDSVVIKPRNLYDKQAIELRADVRVEGLDPRARTVRLSTGDTLEYDGCVIATGARPLQLPVPGADLPGVHVLRTLDQAMALRDAMQNIDTAVVIGGGLIGIELAVALSKLGIETTLLARETWLYGHVAPAPLGASLDALLRAGGVDVQLQTTVTRIEARAETLAVHAADGRVFEGQIVPTGVGVRPNVEFLENTGLAGSDGVDVDPFLRTPADGLVAAGDLARMVHPVTGARYRVEHWLHAQHQGRHAAETLTSDDPRPYERVSSYDTDLFGVPLAVVGAPDQARSWSYEGDLAGGAGVAYGAEGETLVAAFALGPSDVADLAERIRKRDRIEG